LKQIRSFAKDFKPKFKGKTKKEKRKKIRKRQKGRGNHFGLARESAHGPSSLPLRIGTEPLSPAADAGAPHVIPSEENGTNTEAIERDPSRLLADRVKP
jgi:hypothetical protein